MALLPGLGGWRQVFADVPQFCYSCSHLACWAGGQVIFCSPYHLVLSGRPDWLPGRGTLPLCLAVHGHPVKKVIVLMNEDLHYFFQPKEFRHLFNFDFFVLVIQIKQI